MVVGAVVVRGRLDDDEERRTTTARLVCATELETVCEALAADDDTDVRIEVEAAADTAARLTELAQGQRAPIDGWLVPGPWPTIVAEARRREARDPLLTTGEVLARSPVVLAVWNERTDKLAPHCQDRAVGWRCLGDNAGRPWPDIGGDADWGPLEVGHAPVSTATGLAVLGAATAGFFAHLPVTALSSAELDDEEYARWLTALEKSIPAGTRPTVATMLQRGPSAFDALGTLETEAGPLLHRSPRNPKPTLLYPSPVVTADVVLGTTGGRSAEVLTELVSGAVGRRALAEAGWHVRGEALAHGLRPDPLPTQSGLPSPGVLDALRQRASEIR